MKQKVLVTPRSLTRNGLETTPALRRLAHEGFDLVSGRPGEQPSHDELLDLVPGCVGWIAGVERIDESILSCAHDLRVISRHGAGTDAIEFESASRLGIKVERAVGGNAQGVAELTLALALMSIRHLAPSARALLDGRWERQMGRELAECTVGVVGIGAIGAIVAKLLSALGANVIAYDPVAAAGAPYPGRPTLASFDDLVSTSDIVTLHCPAPADNSSLIGEREVAAMPAGSVLINTARSALVDDKAVLTALQSGHLAGYAVDAFDAEPPAPSELLVHPRVIATAHIGAYTSASTDHTAEMAVDNLLSHLERK